MFINYKPVEISFDNNKLPEGATDDKSAKSKRREMQQKRNEDSSYTGDSVTIGGQREQKPLSKERQEAQRRLKEFRDNK